MNENKINEELVSEKENNNELLVEFEKLKAVVLNEHEDNSKHQELMEWINKCILLCNEISEANKIGSADEEISRINDLLTAFSNIKVYCISLKDKEAMTSLEMAELKFLRDTFIPSINYKSGKFPVFKMHEIKNPKHLQGHEAKELREEVALHR